MEEINESGKMQSIKKVSMEEAIGFLDMKKKQAKTIANVVLMCIISPAVLIFLAGLAEKFILTENPSGHSRWNVNAALRTFPIILICMIT